MDLHLLPAFVLATAALILLPGPNVALIVANSVAHGTRYGFLTVLGTCSAMVPQLLLTGLGLTEVLGRMGVVFEWVRWAGVAYLVVLGVRQWRAAPADLTGVRAQPRSARGIYGRAVLVSLANPKTLLFYGTFFPQFILPGRPVGPQVALLSAVFLAVALLLDGGWAVLAGRVRFLLAGRERLRNRVSGGILVGAGLGLAVVRRK